MVEPRDSPLSPGLSGAGAGSSVSSSVSGGGSLLQRMAAAVAAQHELASSTGASVKGTLITPANGESGPRRVWPM